MVCSTPKMGCEVKFCFSISAITASICSLGAPGRMMIIIMKDSFSLYIIAGGLDTPFATNTQGYSTTELFLRPALLYIFALNRSETASHDLCDLTNLLHHLGEFFRLQ